MTKFIPRFSLHTKTNNTRAYQPRHELWPIPLVEMERNTNLTQTPGW